MIPLLLLLAASCSRARSGGGTLLAVLPSIGGHLGELRRAVSDADSRLERDLHLSAVPFVGPPGGDGPTFLQGLCGAIGARPAALLSLVAPPAAFFVSLVGGYAGLPVFASAGGYRDEASESMNRHFISLDPGAEDLAEAVSALLQAAANGTAFVVRQADSPFYSRFARSLESSSGQVLKVLPVDSEDQPFLVLDAIFGERVQIVVLACGRALADRVLQTASALSGDGRWTWILVEEAFHPNASSHAPPGAMGVRLRSGLRPSIRSAVGLAAAALSKSEVRLNLSLDTPPSCWFPPDEYRRRFSAEIHRVAVAERKAAADAIFDVFLYRDEWEAIGNVSGGDVSPPAVLWSIPSQGAASPHHSLPRYRVVTAMAAPFVLPSTRMENGSCLTGMPCLQVATHSQPRIIRLLADFSLGSRTLEGSEYNVSCCAGIAIDLLRSLSTDLQFETDLYLVADGLFGSKKGSKWNGVVRDLVSGSAHMSLTALSTSSERSLAIDYSVPFQQSGVSCLARPPGERAVPLTAFLVPFSPQLWLAIFAALNLTAVVSAIYEWVSPFGLNPRGRSRTRNFSLASALWVMWSLLFSHLVAFKAPKSWPNKVLINLWGCFSVIFVSTYTANIAAHFAGLMMVRDKIGHLRDTTLLNQRTGTVRASSSESYIRAQNPQLWQHIHRYGSDTLDEALQKLKRGDLDVIIGDTPLLDYVRGEDCELRLLGQPIFEDAYAIGMQKGFPLKDSISTMLLRYGELGLMERLRDRWLGPRPCLGLGDGLGVWGRARPLSPRAVAGVFVALALGVAVGLVILLAEHAVFKYALPRLRASPRGIWKSTNLMFFSQKLYRFINIVELVSPHHSAKELASNLRRGRVFWLFQKSMKKMNLKEAKKKRNPQIYDLLQEMRLAAKEGGPDNTGDPSAPSSLAPSKLLNRRSFSLSDVRPASQKPLLLASRRASSWNGETQSEKVPVDDLILRAMTKEELLRCWQASEKRLLHLLEKAIKANIALEKKLICLQRALVK